MTEDRNGPDAFAEQPELSRLAYLAFQSAPGHIFILLDSHGRIMALSDDEGRAEHWCLADVEGQHHEIFYAPDEVASGQPAADLEAAPGEAPNLNGTAGAFANRGWNT